MALKLKKPFGPGFTVEGKALRRGRDLLEQERKRKRDFRKLQGKPRKIGRRT